MPNYKCMGCYIDTLAWLLPGGEKVSDEMDNQFCADMCADSAFFGTESDRSCIALAASAVWAADWDCNAQCSRSKTTRQEICGGVLF